MKNLDDYRSAGVDRVEYRFAAFDGQLERIEVRTSYSIHVESGQLRKTRVVLRKKKERQTGASPPTSEPVESQWSNPSELPLLTVRRDMNPFDAFSLGDLVVWLFPLRKRLSPRKAEAIRMYFGVEREDVHTYQKVGIRLGVCADQARNIVNDALLILRQQYDREVTRKRE